MCTNCAPLLTDLFVYSYEAGCVLRLLRDKNKKTSCVFQTCIHIIYTYNVQSINNHNFHNYVHFINPDESEIKDSTESDISASYLDILLNID
jgi:hypothetical protein